MYKVYMYIPLRKYATSPQMIEEGGQAVEELHNLSQTAGAAGRGEEEENLPHFKHIMREKHQHCDYGREKRKLEKKEKINIILYLKINYCLL